MSTMEEDQIATRETAIGLLNGCGLGAVLWTLIIVGVRLWL